MYEEDYHYEFKNSKMLLDKLATQENSSWLVTPEKKK